MDIPQQDSTRDEDDPEVVKGRTMGSGHVDTNQGVEIDECRQSHDQQNRPGVEIIAEQSRGHHPHKGGMHDG
ncbi:MAG: hypothetical protein U5K37_03695 [Natrialbaceae archaeon]|nr:hypothetical protein [Natrialbaceae archaeon]